VALDDLGLEVDFPALLVAAYWVERHCVIPDGFRRGDPFDLVGWQAAALLNFYRLRPTARVGQLATAFHFRRSQLVGPQKCGKAPYTAAHVCLEGVGPALFAGWARGGERWDCRDHGCGCGWVYEYQPGEAMGQAWPTSLIQVTAFSEKQTDNIYSALRPMINDGPLSVLIPKTGEEMIRLPANGRIDVVTSEARSRLGARVTFVPQDETGIWTESAKMVEVAKTQRRGLAGMGGRAEETTNAWDPNQNSVAQQTADAAEKRADIYRWHPQAPKGLSYRNKAERRKIHEHVYEGCAWIDLDGIEGEAAELLLTDPGNAERFFGNRSVAGAGVAFDIDLVKSRKQATVVPKGSIITVGVDGALLDDALALVATDVKTGFTWPLAIIERPENADDDYRHDQAKADGAMIEAMETFVVWRVYIDDQYIDSLVEKWKNRYGDKRVIVWRTNRPRNMAWAVRELTEAMAAPIGSPQAWTYNGEAVLTTHFQQAQKAPVNILDDKERPMYILSKDSTDSPRKKDGADAAVLSWKARSDAIELGIVRLDGDPQVPVEPEPAQAVWRPGDDVPEPSLWRQPVASDGYPMGFMG
jgi:hypothetical protein